MIEFKDGRYFVGVWFIGDGETDCMYALYRDSSDPENKWTMIYRFRYYESDDAWDGKDRKSWYKTTGTGTEAQMETNVKFVIDKIVDSWPDFKHRPVATNDFVPMHSDNVTHNLETFTARPWVHVRKMEKGELDTDANQL